MNKKVIIISILIIGLFFISVIATIEINSDPRINSINSTVHENNTKSNPTIINIVMRDDYYLPNKLNISINLNVKFNLTNKGNNDHTFTFDNTSYGIDVSVISGQNATVDFTAPSTPQVLGFHCRYHQRYGMTGTINIYNPNTTTTSITNSNSNTATSSVDFNITLLPTGLVLLALISHRKKKEV